MTLDEAFRAGIKAAREAIKESIEEFGPLYDPSDLDEIGVEVPSLEELRSLKP